MNSDYAAVLAAAGLWVGRALYRRYSGKTPQGHESRQPPPKHATGVLLRAPRPSVVFLDIDGVVSPGFTETLTQIPLFEDFLRRHPTIDVVISSNWRCHASMEYLLGLFSPDVRNRIAGATDEEPGIFAREKEVTSFATRHQLRSWIALDDEHQLFSPGFANLYLTNHRTGLIEADVEQLDWIVSQWR